jgi:hypothetical protein
MPQTTYSAQEYFAMQGIADDFESLARIRENRFDVQACELFSKNLQLEQKQTELTLLEEALTEQDAYIQKLEAELDNLLNVYGGLFETHFPTRTRDQSGAYQTATALLASEL